VPGAVWPALDCKRTPHRCMRAPRRALRQPTVTDQVWLELEVDGQPAGRVVLGLHGSDCPETVRNFVALGGTGRIRACANQLLQPESCCARSAGRAAASRAGLLQWHRPAPSVSTRARPPLCSDARAGLRLQVRLSACCRSPYMPSSACSPALPCRAHGQRATAALILAACPAGAALCIASCTAGERPATLSRANPPRGCGFVSHPKHIFRPSHA
jgi:hypothetical protein